MLSKKIHTPCRDAGSVHMYYEDCLESAVFGLLNHFLVGGDVDFYAAVLGASGSCLVGGNIVGHRYTLGGETCG